MKIQSPIEIPLIARPANPTDGKVLIYADALTGEPVWHDKDGVHKFCTCDDNPPIIPVTGVTLNMATVMLIVEEVLILTPIITPSNATNKNVTWMSSDTSIATVDADGKVTAIASGEATITVTTEDGGYMATCVLTVEDTPDSVTLLGMEWLMSDISGLHSFEEASDMAAEVFGTGKRLPTLAEFSALAALPHVWDDVLKGMWFAEDGADLKNLLKSLFLPAEGYRTGGDGELINQGVEGRYWSSSSLTVNDSGGLDFDSGNATTRWVDPDHLFSVIFVNSSTVPVTGVILNETSINLAIGETLTLTPTVFPESATNKNVMWGSYDTAVATVDADGKVTAVGTGVTTITVTTEDGNRSAYCAVTVSAGPVTLLGIEWDAENAADFVTFDEANAMASSLGKRLPTKEECEALLELPYRLEYDLDGIFIAEQTADLDDPGKRLFLPFAGFSSPAGGVSRVGITGLYWSSTSNAIIDIERDGSSHQMSSWAQSFRLSVRCVKDV